MHQFARHYYEFGPFRVEPEERVLMRAGELVPLTPKAFETLLVLVERRGHVVDKEELLKRVWPDTFVEDSTLAKNIWTLRKVFGAEDDEPSYIETIPRRGYRFVAPVKEVVEEPVEPPLKLAKEAEADSEAGDWMPSASGNDSAILPNLPNLPNLNAADARSPAAAQGVRSLPARRLGWALALLTIGLAAGMAIWWVAFRHVPTAPAPNSRVVPLTTFPGRETQVAFSPDGGQIAFVWNGPQGDNADIYVKLIDAETPLRLTTDPSDDSSPVWSPDGKSIFFLRQSVDHYAYYQIPALGGAERKLADVGAYSVSPTGNSPYISPDGKYLAISERSSSVEPQGLFLLSAETAERRRLTSPPKGTVGDYYPAFSPDGKWLAFARATSMSTNDLYLLALPDGESKRLTLDNLTIRGIAWTADSRELVFSSQRGGGIRYLWRIAAAGGMPERLTAMGQNVSGPAVSSQGNRLAFTQSLDDSNIWRIELNAARKGQSPVNLIASSLSDSAPDYSPDGRKIVFASNRSGGFGLWVCESDGSKPRLLIDRGPYLTGTPRWSPDGRWIAFDSRSNDPDTAGNPDIYVISSEGGPPRRLTTDPVEDVAPSWSRDGRWVYFGSTRGGSMQIWKAPAAGGQAVQVTREGGFEGFESPDGKSLYYAKGRSIPGIWQVPIEGGEERLVLDHHQAGLWRYWRVADQGIYFVTAATPGPSLLEFFSFATGQVSEVARLERAPEKYTPGLAVSPDGRHLLCVWQDRSGSDLMMVENFR